MRKQAIMLMALAFMALLGPDVRAEGVAADIKGEPNLVTIEITKSKVVAQVFEISYKIINGSDQDIWICESIISWPYPGPDFEVYIPEGSETLTIRRRLAVPGKEHREWALPPFATYVRLPAGRQRSESLTLALPIHPVVVLGQSPRRDNTMYATRLLIEIGFHESDLRKMILDAPGKSAKAYTMRYEAIRDRDRIFMLAVQGRSSEAEQVVSTISDVPRVPCAREELFSSADWPKPPDLSDCTRVTVEYHPSMLDYLFPSITHQSLLSHAEKEYLHSQKTISTDRPEQIAPLRGDIRRGKWSVIVGQDDRADVLCWRDDTVLTSFAIFSDDRLLMGNGLQFKYANPLGSLRALTPQVEPYELRVQCARTLKNLWYRFRLFHRGNDAVGPDSSGDGVIKYPAAARWTDAIMEAYRTTGLEDPTGRPYSCPSADEGKCDYAMNPECEPNSPADMVLLFETKDGWNQHGGPELFTFDNHDPKGGLVLLNGGTVKFIRTEEELKQLRWK
jgi:hypothetical protein